ncbi:MAG: peptidase S9, partial [Acidobacteria bacterium]
MRKSLKIRLLFVILIVTAITTATSFSKAHTSFHAAQSFTMEQIKSYPFPNELSAAASGSRIAWAFNERGLRNVWVAEGPDFKARRLTDYNVDDGQELTSLSLSADGKYVVYVRGGDHGSNFDSSVGVNPALAAVQTKVQVWSVQFGGGEPKLLGEGDEPVISPKSDRVAYVKDRGIWTAPIDGATTAKRMFYARGDCGSPEWSPDGSRMGFV